MRGNLEPTNLVMLYLASVVISAIFLGRGPSLLAAIAGVLAFDFFLVPPYLTFAVSDTQYLITFVMLFVVSLVISSLTARGREQAEAAIRRESQTAALYNLRRDLTSATDLNDVAEIIISQHRASLWTRGRHLPSRKRTPPPLCKFTRLPSRRKRTCSGGLGFRA